MAVPNYAQLWERAIRGKTNTGNQYKDKPETARAYDRSVSIWSDGRQRAKALPFELSDTVLDIGSGPGVLAIPLAHRVKAVTVVEPSETMLELLQEHCTDENINNIEAINGNWEDVNTNSLPEHDYVIASYCLAMPDIRTALKAMDEAARKKVFLYWFCGLASWEKLMVDLYPVVHGKPFFPSPKSDILYGVLCQLGISAQVRHLKGTSFDRVFADTDAALADLRGRLRLDTNKYDEKLRQYIAENYYPNGSKWIFRDETNYVEISWITRKKEEVA